MYDRLFTNGQADCASRPGFPSDYFQQMTLFHRGKMGERIIKKHGQRSADKSPGQSQTNPLTPRKSVGVYEATRQQTPLAEFIDSATCNDMPRQFFRGIQGGGHVCRGRPIFSKRKIITENAYLPPPCRPAARRGMGHVCIVANYSAVLQGECTPQDTQYVRRAATIGSADNG